MLLALDFIVQWPPIGGVVSSNQGQNTSCDAIIATLYTYESEHSTTTMIPLVWYCTVDPSLRLNGYADTSFVPLGALVDLVVSGSSDESVTKCYDTSGTINTTGVSADCEFIPSVVTKSRGGRGAYSRTTYVQPHHYIYAVTPTKKDSINITGFADSYFKSAKFSFLKQLPKYTPEKQVYEYTPELSSYNFATLIAETEYTDYSNILLQEEEEILCQLLCTDIKEDIVFVSMAGKHTNNDDSEILEILGYL